MYAKARSVASSVLGKGGGGGLAGLAELDELWLIVEVASWWGGGKGGGGSGGCRLGVGADLGHGW